MKYTQKQVEKFLKESNAIEQVYDDVSFEQAKEAWAYLSTVEKLTVHDVLKTHKILMLHQNLMPNEKGYFRKVPVWIGRREGLDWREIHEAIDSWVLDVETSIKIPGEDGINIWLDHIEYERIHGFCDGNGRTGRLFMNWARIQAGLPIFVIHADWPKEGGEQKSYYKIFQEDSKDLTHSAIRHIIEVCQNQK